MQFHSLSVEQGPVRVPVEEVLGAEEAAGAEGAAEAGVNGAAADGEDGAAAVGSAVPLIVTAVGAATAVEEPTKERVTAVGAAELAALAAPVVAAGAELLGAEPPAGATALKVPTQLEGEGAAWAEVVACPAY